MSNDRNEIDLFLESVCKQSDKIRLNDERFNENAPSTQRTNGSKVRKSKGTSVFSKNLRNLLKEKGLSLREAARIAGVSPSVMSGWTGGSVPNDPLALLRLTETLGVDFQMLLTGKPANPVSVRDIHEAFEVEEAIEFSGVFLIEAKRLQWRK